MLDICCNFGKDFNVKFNDSKSICIEFGSQCYRAKDVRMNGVPLKWDQKVSAHHF